MKYNDWKLLSESIGSGVTLGLSKPNVVGGLIGANYTEGGCKSNTDETNPMDALKKFMASHEDDELDHEDDELDHEDDELDHEDDELDHEDDELDHEDDELDHEDDELDHEDDELDHEDDELDHEDDELDHEDDELDHEDDESFLKDIDPELVNPNQEKVDNNSGDMHKDTLNLLKMMSSYCGKYMKAESVEGEKPETKELTAAQEKLPEKLKLAILKNKKNKKNKIKEKDHEEKDHEDTEGKKNCNCESDEFLKSLSKQVSMNKNFSEDSLVKPAYNVSDEEQKPGDVGFAPQGKIGSIGGGYTKDDLSEIPVLGESHKFPTLTEWMANRSKSSN